MTIARSRAFPGSGVANNLDTSATFGALQVQGRRLSIRASWTGTPTGTFALQCSFDGGATWQDVPGAGAEFTANSQAQPAGSASGGVWNWSNVPGSAIRLNWTRSGGAGTLVALASWGD